MTKSYAFLTSAVIIFAGGACANNGATQQMVDTSPTTQASVPFAIIYRAGPSWRPGVPMEQQGLRDHFYYLRALDNDDRIVAAGPLGPDGGLIIVLARDQSEADSVIAADPAVVSGLFAGEATRFIPRFVGKKPLLPIAP